MNFGRNEFISLAVVRAYEDFHLDWRLGMLTCTKKNTKKMEEQMLTLQKQKKK